MMNEKERADLINEIIKLAEGKKDVSFFKEYTLKKLQNYELKRLRRFLEN